MTGIESIHWSASFGLLVLHWSVCATAQPTETSTAVSQTSDTAVAAAMPPGSTAVAAAELHSFRVHAVSPIVRLEIHTLHDDVVARCLENCQLRLPKGDYHAMLYDTAGKLRGVAPFTVEGEGGVDIEPGNPTAATTGQVLGIAGTAMLPIALLLLLSSTCIDECEITDAKKVRGKIGLGMLAAGAVLTPVGWVMYRRNNHPDVSPYIKLEVGPSLTPAAGGAVFGLAGRF